MADQGSIHFDEKAREAIYQVVSSRRDMRHFISDATVDENVMQRILQAAHMAPSVGLMQPWHIVRIKSPLQRKRLADEVDRERMNTAQALGDKRETFLRLKVEGVRESAELLVVVLKPDDGTLFGRRTMPHDMAVASCSCAIQNMWLASRVENLGMGWVSLFDPDKVAEIISAPEGSRPLALLCLGPVEKFYQAPMLEVEGWRKGRAFSEMISQDHYDV